MANFLNDLFVDTELVDIIFVVEKEEIPGHRLVFAKACDYFKKLLYGDFQESQLKRIEITETSTKLFQEVKRFIYLGRLEIVNWTLDDLLGLLSLAHEYHFELLFSEVIKAVEVQPLNFDSWTLIHSVGAIYDSDALKRKCISFAEQKIEDFIHNKDLEMFTSEFIRFMFALPKISICDQNALLRAICKWKMNKSTAKIMAVFQNICWKNVSPKINEIILKELFSPLKNADNLNFWNEVDTGIIKSSECVPIFDNVMLEKNCRKEFPLPKYQCSIRCCLYSDMIQLWFRKDESDYEIAIKSIEWESLNGFIIQRVYGCPKSLLKIDMDFSQPTANNCCFQSSATFSDGTLVYFINIYSEHFKDVSVIRLQNLIIS